MILDSNTHQSAAYAMAASERERQQRLPVVNRLSAYVMTAFNDAVLHRQTTGVTERLLNCLRLRSGRYDATKAAQIAAKGGSDQYFNITGPKCESFEAWMSDTFTPSDDRPWDARPTPIPSLPKGSAAAVVEQTVAEFAGREDIAPGEIEQFALDLYDETQRAMFEDATKRCERMVAKMADQTAEGGFAEALAGYNYDLSTYPTAFLKGPIQVRRDRQAWEGGKVVIKSEIIPTWTSPDPNNMYPGPNARNVNESYVCEVVDFDRRELSMMRGVDGWDTQAIESVLGQSETQAISTTTAGGDTLPGSNERATANNQQPDVNGGLPLSNLRAVEYWGSVPGYLIADWGVKGIADKFKYYEVNCIMIGSLVVRTVLNPDMLGRRPYYSASFAWNKNSIWGIQSIPERMEDCQDGVNGAQRNLINNLAIAAGPMVAVDLDTIPVEHVPFINRLHPWKVFVYRGSKAPNGRDPVKFFQPDSNSTDLLKVSEYYEKAADERTLVPRYQHGSADIGGAGDTASGLSMLMDASSRGVKRVIKMTDLYVLRPAIERLYEWNMINIDDPSIKGDVQVIPRGALAMMTRQQTQMRRQEFLSMTNNPTDLQIIGIEGRAALLREIAKGLDMPVDKIVPDEKTLRERVATQMMQQQPPGDEEEAA